MGTIIISLLIFGILVIFHEFGHYMVAKMTGVKVEEFAVGMGPKLFSFQKGETLYSLRILPLGGFCKMLGEDEESYDKRSLNNQGKLQRTAIFAAGSFMNILLAILLFSLIFYIVGTPTTIIEHLEKDYPAYQAGIRSGDKIVNINNQSIHKYSEISSIIESNGDKPLKIIIERNEDVKELTIQPKYDENLQKYRIGIAPKSISSFSTSITYSIEQTLFLTKSIFGVLGQLVVGKANADDFIGPVGIVAIVGETAKNGLLPVINLAAMISLNLGIFNLLPIPALDGSRLMFLAIEAIRGKPINPEKEGIFHFVGFILLLVLAVFIGYRDVIRFTNFF